MAEKAQMQLPGRLGRLSITSWQRKLVQVLRKSVITFHTIGVVGYLQGPCCRSLQFVGVDRGDGRAPGCQVGGDGVHGSDGDGSYGGACGGGGGDIKWRLYLTFPTCS